MKLYTEEQVKKAIDEARTYDIVYRTYEEVIRLLTPIKLPSDEEIRERAVEGDEDWVDDGNSTIADEYERGAKWVIKQIKNNAR